LSKTKGLSMPIRTDQRSCYGAGGAEIPCEGTGQDGDLNKGRPWPEPRFEVDGDQVLDRLTGSVWTRSANLPGFPLTWAEAWNYVEEMNRRGMFGRSDWTLPSRSGLFSLISHARINPALPLEHPFVDVFSGYYWTGEGVARYLSQSWYIHLGGGRVFKGMKHGSYMVWPVVEPRSSNNGPDTGAEASEGVPRRFVNHGTTVLDRSTGLEWTRQAGLKTGAVDWHSALEAIRSMNAQKEHGGTDWRLPNVRELESIVCLDDYSPALTGDHPFENTAASYWSATTSVYEPTYAWVLHMDDGAIGVGFKQNKEFGAWPVRDGNETLLSSG